MIFEPTPSAGHIRRRHASIPTSYLSPLVIIIPPLIIPLLTFLFPLGFLLGHLFSILSSLPLSFGFFPFTFFSLCHPLQTIFLLLFAVKGVAFLIVSASAKRTGHF